MGSFAYVFIGVAAALAGLTMIQLKMSLEERKWRKRAVRKKEKLKL